MVDKILLILTYIIAFCVLCFFIYGVISIISFENTIHTMRLINKEEAPYFDDKWELEKRRITALSKSTGTTINELSESFLSLEISSLCNCCKKR